MANLNECKYAGIDVKIVEKFEERVTKLLADMAKHKLSLFCGSACSIRYNDFKNNRELIVGHFSGRNTDGGDGAIYPDEDGLERGE
jgi:hypothetical protein